MKDVNGGLCHACADSGRREARDIVSRHQQTLDAKKAGVDAYSSGLGECPSCHHRNISEIPTTKPNPLARNLIVTGVVGLAGAGGAYLWAGPSVIQPCIVSGIVGLGVLAFGISQPAKVKVASLYLCNSCGNRWDSAPPT